MELWVVPGVIVGVGVGVGPAGGFIGGAGMPPFVLHAVNPATAKPAAKTSANIVLIITYRPILNVAQ